MKRQAFTLVELLVVIAIIGLLSTVAVVSMNSTRANAKIVKAKADLQQIYKRIEIVRSNNNSALIYITGNNASDWPCRGRNVDGLPSSDACITGLTTAFAAIGISPLPRDPWGHPYMFDENEMEAGACGAQDNLYSVGLDAVDSGGGGDDINFPIPYYQCR